MITHDHPEWPDMRDKMLLPRIETLRSELESPLLTPEQTAGIRGQIAAYRDIIGMVERTKTAMPQRNYAS